MPRGEGFANHGGHVVVPSQRREGERHVVERGARARLERKQRAIGAHGGLVPAGHEEHEARLRKVRVNASRARPRRVDARERLDLLFRAALAPQRDREIEERFRRVGRHAQGVEQHLLAFGELLHLDQHGAEHDAPAGILRILVHLARRGRECFLALPLSEQRRHVTGSHRLPFEESQSSASAARVSVPSLRLASST